MPALDERSRSSSILHCSNGIALTHPQAAADTLSSQADQSLGLFLGEANAPRLIIGDSRQLALVEYVPVALGVREQEHL
jgi:hypothetical protein